MYYKYYLVQIFIPSDLPANKGRSQWAFPGFNNLNMGLWR